MSGRNRKLKIENVIALGIIAISLIIYFYNCGLFKFIQDDAFIVFRYAENFVSGNGLVFNSGERVEGYTSFSWLMILSAVKFFGFDIIQTAQYLSIFFGAAVLVELFFLSKLLITKLVNNDKVILIVSSLPSLMLSLTGGFIYWSVSAMETSFFLFLILFAVYIYLKNSFSKIFPWIMAAASITRPEAILIFVLILLHRIFNKDYTNLKYQALFYASTIILFLAFRLTYYGYLFPNTFYAKTELTLHQIYLGIIYFLNTIKSYGIFGLLIVLPTIYSLKEIRERESNFFLFVILPFIGAVILIGGDVLPLHRFSLPFLPFLYIFFIAALFNLLKKIFAHQLFLQINISLVIGLLFTISFKLEIPSIYNWRGYELGLVEKMKIYAAWVKDQSEITGRTKSVALSTIGAFSYYSGAKVIDLIGLTDEYIAHNPKPIDNIAENVDVLWKERNYNADYIIESAPDYIIFPAGAKPSAYPEAAIFSKSEFQQNYYPQLIYSHKLDVFLPVFTKYRDIVESKYDNNCGIEFVGNYINANTRFIAMMNNGNKNLKNGIIEECNKMIESCPIAETYAFTVLGYTYFHTGELQKAEEYLLLAVEKNEMNSIAYAYLINLYAKTGIKEKEFYYLKKLKNISPDAFPNLIN